MRKIQLKQVLRNKRFVLFTIILPIGWYIFFYQLQKGVSPSILLGIAVFIGNISQNTFLTDPDQRGLPGRRQLRLCMATNESRSGH